MDILKVSIGNLNSKIIMAKPKTKKRLLEIAIAASPRYRSIRSFAKHLDVSHTAVLRILSGKSRSKKLTRKIDNFIRTELSKLYGGRISI
jgi:hypothetical protein